MWRGNVIAGLRLRGGYVHKSLANSSMALIELGGSGFPRAIKSARIFRRDRRRVSDSHGAPTLGPRQYAKAILAIGMLVLAD